MEYKFRQPLTDINGNFKEWFYWGFIDDTFITPVTQLNGYDTRNKSQMWTGLLDKNGVEIYEGDIVKQPIEEYNGRFTELVGYGIYEIKFKDDIYMNVGEGEGEWLCLEEFRGCEVVGNIYENPELLNAK